MYARKFEWVDINLPKKNIISEDLPTGRVYTDLDTGEKFFSVTTMLGKTSDDSWYGEWVARIGVEEAVKESERCCDRGNKIHLACELYVQNAPLEAQLQAAAEYRNMANQLKSAIFTHVGKIVAAEIPVFSRIMRVGGRFDLLAEWRGVLSLIDYKGSNYVKGKQDIEDYQDQLCAYSFALEETYGIRVENLVNIISNEKRNSPTILTCKRSEIAPRLAKRIKSFHKILESANK